LLDSIIGNFGAWALSLWTEVANEGSPGEADGTAAGA